MTDSRTEESRARLRRLVRPGQTVFTVLRRVSRSGMRREIAVYLMEDNPKREDSPAPRDISPLVADALDLREGKSGGVLVRGCGMDMGFHVVYELSRALYADGFICIGRKRHCPSNDHTNGDKNYRPHRHGDGGYALRHRWL